MLAIYLTSGEVENDRRALNVFYGMRRAKKEGRWVSTASIGYLNRITELGKKYITPDGKYSEIMKWAFETIADSNLTVVDVWRIAKKKGLRCGKNNFWVAIRNPVYCGLIFIPKYRDEESRIVKGQAHAPYF